MANKELTLSTKYLLCNSR
ncbi:unnamed protein product [Callosobruchus maculatus]|uniref:Uncharacterized protein n=1 Tax=Callosobruchus maculatus TaxID=64391 RepID=A0A653BQ19_CALMS|nr:unnamed protein product [Callosobruchus maculatus]